MTSLDVIENLLEDGTIFSTIWEFTQMRSLTNASFQIVRRDSVRVATWRVTWRNHIYIYSNHHKMGKQSKLKSRYLIWTWAMNLAPLQFMIISWILTIVQAQLDQHILRKKTTCWRFLIQMRIWNSGNLKRWRSIYLFHQINQSIFSSLMLSLRY